MIDQSIYVFIISEFIWLSVVSYFLYKTISHYNNLTNRVSKQTLSQVLDQILQEAEKNKKSTNELSEQLSSLILESKYHIQKFGVIRYNPFSDTGGEQSFILAFLDALDNGIVLTSLHSRDSTRWYIRQVKEGKGVDIDLSEEEKRAIVKSSKISYGKVKEFKKDLNLHRFIKASG